MNSADYYIDPASESTYCDNWPDCTHQIAVILPVPERHRKPGGDRKKYLCEDCASGQEQEWEELDDAARALVYEQMFGWREPRTYAEKHGV